MIFFNSNEFKVVPMYLIFPSLYTSASIKFYDNTKIQKWSKLKAIISYVLSREHLVFYIKAAPV